MFLALKWQESQDDFIKCGGLKHLACSNFGIYVYFISESVIPRNNVEFEAFFDQIHRLKYKKPMLLWFPSRVLASYREGMRNHKNKNRSWIPSSTKFLAITHHLWQ